MSRIAWIPTALFVVAVPLFLVTAGVAWAFNNPGIYHSGFEKYDVSLVTGITDEDLRQVSSVIRGYFNSRDEPLNVRTRIFGVESELFNQREISHMRDVKQLVWGVYVVAGVSALYLVAAAAVGVVRRRHFETLARRSLWGGGLTLALILAVGLFALVGFDALFLKFHQLSFSNEFWQLDPRTDRLVMLFPQDFWFDATMWIAARAVAAAVVLTLLSGGYLVYLRRSEHKRVTGAISQLKY